MDSQLFAKLAQTALSTAASTITAQLDGGESAISRQRMYSAASVSHSINADACKGFN